jgi:DNA-binding Xre family transcriptional regulator
MPIIYKLEDTLKELDITKNKLATEGKFRVATLHELEKGKSKSISFEILEKIIVTLNELTSEEGLRKVTLNDVIDFVEENTTQSSTSPDKVVDD